MEKHLQNKVVIFFYCNYHKKHYVVLRIFHIIASWICYFVVIVVLDY